VRRSVVTKLVVGGMIVWYPFESCPTARISGFDSAKEELRSTEDLFKMQTIVIISAQ